MAEEASNAGSTDPLAILMYDGSIKSKAELRIDMIDVRTGNSKAVTLLILYFLIKLVIGNKEMTSNVENINRFRILYNVYNKTLIITKYNRDVVSPIIIWF